MKGKFFFVVGNKDFDRRGYKGAQLETLFLYDIKEDAVFYLGCVDEYHGTSSFAVFLFEE